MAKAKTARRRPREYDHEYGLGGHAKAVPKARPAEAATSRKAAKKR
jgi:hypothetical protein